MERHAAVFVAVTLLLAGCVGGQGGPAATTDSDAELTTDATTAETTTAEVTAGETTDGDATTAEATNTDATTAEVTDADATTGDADSSERRTAVNFYVSDEVNAMDDFAHLNVTISKVGLKRAGGGDANWTTYDVDGRTVDLTELKGANATRLGTFDVENGTYEMVFVHVSEVNGTLKDGERVRVKLPSEKLQLHQSFTVGANQSVDYVFDISVFAAGKSGKYILKPVISESGTDEEIEDVDEKESEDEEDETEDDEKENEDDEEGKETEDDSENETESDDAPTLNATFVGNVTAGANATVSVTRNGSAVANATVSVDGEAVGETNADGTLTFSVPDREELEVEIETADASTELERSLKDDDGGDEENDGGSEDDEKGGGNGDD